MYGVCCVYGCRRYPCLHFVPSLCILHSLVAASVAQAPSSKRCLVLPAFLKGGGACLPLKVISLAISVGGAIHMSQPGLPVTPLISYMLLSAGLCVGCLRILCRTSCVDRIQRCSSSASGTGLGVTRATGAVSIHVRAGKVVDPTSQWCSALWTRALKCEPLG